jgi:hypothetical protein
MLDISVEKTLGSFIELSPMSVKRDWMDQTPQNHAYRCFPVTQANVIGWSLSCTEDIEFIWNGEVNTQSDSINVLKGKHFLNTGRGQATVSIVTGLTFKTDKDISMFTINPVNYFNNDFETMSSLFSTSWVDTDLPLAIKAKIANKPILIKANTPIATIIPISLTAINDTSIKMFDYSDPDRKRQTAHRLYGKAAQALNTVGEWTDWYRDAINEKGESLGSHEVKVLKLKVEDNRKNNNG